MPVGLIVGLVILLVIVIIIVVLVVVLILRHRRTRLSRFCVTLLSISLFVR